MDFSNRINRIIGQLKGIERMSKSKRDCSEILQQVSAIKKAIDSLSKEIVMSDICKFMSKEDAKRVEAMVERAISL